MRLGVVSGVLVFILSSYASGQFPLMLDDAKVKERKDGILTLMGFTVLPDVTTSSLSINDAASGNTDFKQTTLGGGFTISQDFPLYLEGTVGYSRYDPKFAASNGDEKISIPVKWNSLSITGGIGWDFPLTENKELKLRPIFNFTFGHVESDISLVGRYLREHFNLDSDSLAFLNNGRMNTYGYGGAIMLDWEHYREDYEVDVELRYTNIQLRSFGSDYGAIEGSSDANIISLWTRWRAPTGLTMLNNPLRYVLEGSNTTFLGAQRDALGFNYLTTVGVGLELDSSDYPVFITRTRVLLRYTFGENVSGYAIGLAMSF
ncbi:autotransporter domain-containing protein [Sulfurovum sp. NBC37-1]|uniref:autotransporter domain-containing protein n=1 Tax=Sulfurovum sp. (strain NBC37-1) TaxID=387093 RepID=UPI0001587A7C|nr:autotransporter domain-containing protein [Sulfurovum sp. NBC37-1]BAF73320.1 conserved hypothetical protein [Sulfurovum sp. NBC37-1]